MTLPSPQVALYNHSLPSIEKWLCDLGCQQDLENLHYWTVDYTDNQSSWKARIILETKEVTVCYLGAAADGSDIRRSFQYSLSREDIENAIFSGP
ncbi:MAG: DUF3143 domain-containing protein [Cyanobacteriota bacterium ELA615]|jgi:hypothetical protein